MIDIDAADEITIDTTSADGHIAITSAHTAGDAILISANANAGSILDIDAGILDIDIQAEATIDAVGVAIGAGSGELDLTTTGTLDVNANSLDMDLTDSSSITITSSEAAEDLTIEQVGGNDSSIIIQAAGTGANAIHLNATGGSIDIDSADNITIDASDDIAITSGTADGLITIHSAHTAGQAILIDANANAGSILDVDAGILDMDIQGAATVTAGGLFKTEAAGVEIENGSSAGAPALLVDNNDTDVIAVDIDAANIDANVLDIAAPALTTGFAINVSADVLTTGQLIRAISDSSTTDDRALTAIINENTAATGTMAMAIRNDAILTANRATVQIKDTAANTAPTLKLIQENNSASGPILRLENDRGANNGADDDTCGTIEFLGTDDASNQTTFAKITAEVADASNGAEGGRLLLGVATHDGEFQNGLVLEDGNAEDEIDVIIGNGSDSLTTISGDLSLNHDSAQIKFGADSDIVLTHDPDKGLILQQATETTNEPVLTLKTTGDSMQGPNLDLILDNSAGEGDDDTLGKIRFYGMDSGNNSTTYAKIVAKSSDITDGDEGGQFDFSVFAGGRAGTAAHAVLLTIGGEDQANDTNAAVIVNEQGIDCDFRVETNDETHMLFVDAATNRVSIGKSTDDPAATLEVTNHASSGATGVPVVSITNNDTDQIALDINAANIDADVVDISADAVTTSHVIDITADALTSGAVMNIVSDSSSTTARSLINVKNDHASATAAIPINVENDAEGPILKGTGANGSAAQLTIKNTAVSLSTGGATTTVSGFFPANTIPIAMGVRVTTTIASNLHITQFGTATGGDAGNIYGDPDVLADNKLDTAGQTAVFGLNFGDQLYSFRESANNLVITCSGTPSAGAVRLALYYYEITAPTG